MSESTSAHEEKIQSGEQSLTKAEIRAAKKEAKLKLKEQAKNDKLALKKSKLEKKQAKSAGKVKRYKRSYVHEKDTIAGNPEVKAFVLFVFIIAVVLGAFYGRIFVLNPQLDENRRNIALIPQLTRLYEGGLLKAKQLRNQLKTIEMSVANLKSGTASLGRLEPQVTEYLYTLQRFQIECENYKLENQPLSKGPEGEGLIKVSLIYRCKGPFLSYLQAITQLQNLDAQVNIEQERINKIENSDLVAIEGQMTFVVNNND